MELHTHHLLGKHHAEAAVWEDLARCQQTTNPPKFPMVFLIFLGGQWHSGVNIWGDRGHTVREVLEKLQSHEEILLKLRGVGTVGIAGLVFSLRYRYS